MYDRQPELNSADLVWLTALARTLTRNWPDADDLVQETWIAARTSPPKCGEVSRKWLARVLRNFHLRNIRARSRRNRREQVVSRSECVASSDRHAEYAELRRKLAESLMGLNEPYRSSLLLVVSEGFTTADIAERDGISELSARRRVRKGRDLLRKKLEHDYGRDWGHWAALLLPIARLPLPGEVAPAAPAPAPGPLWTSGGLGWGTTLPAAVAAGAVTLGLLAFAQQPENLPLAEAPAFEVTIPTTGSLAWPGDAPRATRKPVAEGLVVEAPHRTATTAGSYEPTNSPLRAAGRVRVRDEFGAVHKPRSGELRLETADGQRVVEVVDGAFELEFAVGARQLIVRNVWLDGRAAIFGQELPIDPLAGAELELEATWLPSTLLHVVDAASGAPIADVTVVADASPRARHGRVFPHPGSFGDDAVVAAGSASPVVLHPRTAYQDVYFVSARGYPWAVFRADHLRGGKRTIALHRGSADLTLHLSGALEGKAHLRAARPGVERLEYGALCEPSVTLEQLAPGPLELEFVLAGGERVVQAVVLAEGENHLWLDPTPSDASAAAPTRSLAGSIRAAEDWFDGEVELRVLAEREHRLPRAEWTPLEGQPGAWSFALTDLAGPTALVEVLGTGWIAEVSLAAHGTTALDIELPAPIVQSIRVTDADSGAVLGANHPRLEVRWAPAAQKGDSKRLPATYEPAAERWQFASVDTPLEVVVSGSGFVPETLYVRPGASREHHVRLHKSSGLVLELRSGHAEADVDLDWIRAVRVTALDGGEGQIYSRAFDGVEMVYSVSRPGRFRLELPRLDGYAPMASREITLLPGEVLRVPVVLEKAP